MWKNKLLRMHEGKSALFKHDITLSKEKRNVRHSNICTDNNEFEFNGKTFKQKLGCQLEP
jgi:hypothetical protein